MLGGPLKWKWVLHELNSHALRANGDADRRIFCASQFGIQSDLTIRSAAQSHWDLLHNHVDSWCMLHAILVPLAQGQSASSLADQSPKATQRDEKSLVQQNAIAEETLSKRPHTHTRCCIYVPIYIYIFWLWHIETCSSRPSCQEWILTYIYVSLYIYTYHYIYNIYI